MSGFSLSSEPFIPATNIYYVPTVCQTLDLGTGNCQTKEEARLPLHGGAFQLQETDKSIGTWVVCERMLNVMRKNTAEDASV